jgi:hypothetical protein
MGRAQNTSQLRFKAFEISRFWYKSFYYVYCFLHCVAAFKLKVSKP